MSQFLFGSAPTQKVSGREVRVFLHNLSYKSWKYFDTSNYSIASLEKNKLKGCHVIVINALYKKHSLNDLYAINSTQLQKQAVAFIQSRLFSLVTKTQLWWLCNRVNWHQSMCKNIHQHSSLEQIWIEWSSKHWWWKHRCFCIRQQAAQAKTELINKVKKNS